MTSEKEKFRLDTDHGLGASMSGSAPRDAKNHEGGNILLNGVMGVVVGDAL